ncbi:MAG: hypothetical protein ACRC0F_12010 [Cetobacterium sp.]
MFKINDTVYCEINGYGIIIDTNCKGNYPIKVKFKRKETGYTSTGSHIFGESRYFIKSLQKNKLTRDGFGLHGTPEHIIEVRNEKGEKQ